MTITVGGTNITFNDATTQTTAPVNTNANVTSVSAGTGISVSATTGAITVSATGGGTVTSVSGTNGLTGTVTTSGSLSLDIYTGTTVQNTSYPIGSYIAALGAGGAAPILNATKAVYCPANGDNNNCVYGASSGAGSSALSGTWRSRGLADQNITNQCLFQRIS